MASVSPPRKSVPPWHLPSSPHCRDSHFTWDKYWGPSTGLCVHITHLLSTYPGSPLAGLSQRFLALSNSFIRLPSPFFSPLSSNFRMQSARAHTAWQLVPPSPATYRHLLTNSWKTSLSMKQREKGSPASRDEPWWFWGDKTHTVPTFPPFISTASPQIQAQVSSL